MFVVVFSLEVFSGMENFIVVINVFIKDKNFFVMS